jgi:catechol 2,3-dioxygenase-like lactoylglutathione lyase family enzyme
MEGQGLLTRLDHVILAVRDLDVASATLVGLLGRRPSWRGTHPGLGTRNALFRLENTYLELLSPGGEGPVAERLRARLGRAGEGLLGLAFGTADADAARTALAARGLGPGPVAAGRGREEASGQEREWLGFGLAEGATRGVPILVVEHRSPPDALPLVAPEAPEAAVLALDHVVVRSADADASRALYGDGLGLRLALERSFPDWGVRLLFFHVGGTTVEVAASLDEAARPDAPDTLWGLSLRVADAEAARERLVAAGFDVSDTRAGRRPGTRVCTVRGEPLGVATLILAPA